MFFFSVVSRDADFKAHLEQMERSVSCEPAELSQLPLPQGRETPPNAVVQKACAAWGAFEPYMRRRGDENLSKQHKKQ